MENKSKLFGLSSLILIMTFACNQGTETKEGQLGERAKNEIGYSMSDTSIDNPDKEWCYLAKSTTVIGVPFQPDVTSVTYDGALYTGYGELCFFYGKNKTPILARQKTFLNGWIPIVQYDWEVGNVRYEIEMFATPLEGADDSNTVNFVKVKVKNIGEKGEEGRFTAAVRGKSSDYRHGNLKDFSREHSYEMTTGTLLRNNKLVYTFSPDAQLDAVNGVEYTKPFTGKEHGITEESNTGLANYNLKLSPGEEKELVFKMPRVPVPIEDSSLIKKIDIANYDKYRNTTIAYWKNILDNKTTFEIPEKRIQDAQKASMVHLLLATRTKEGNHKTQTDGIPYPNFFLTSSPQMVLAYLSNGQPEYAKLSVLNAIKQQEEDGLYFDKSLAHGRIIPAAHGHILYAATSYYLYTRDKKTGEEIFPSLQKAMVYLKNSIEKNKYGLLPPAYPYDNEMINGHYTSTNLWTLLGLRYAIRMARDLGKIDIAAQWEALEKEYGANIMKGIKSSVKEDGYVPPGLYPYLTGEKAREGFKEYQTHSDWENMLLSYPTEVLAPEDPRVKGTLDHVRKGYAEGIMTYRHGQHLHQYITANLIEQYMVRGETRQALIDFYHLILHSGSTHEGFENLVEPWTDRQVSEECPPPHAWASAKTAFLIRNFLIHEFGGKAGINGNERDLYLFSVISPNWAKIGDRIAINNAPTEMGNVNASMEFKENRAEVRIKSIFHEKPGAIKIRIPYFKELMDFETDAIISKKENGYIVLSPDVTYVNIKWKDIPETHRGTFEDILLAYRSTNSFQGVDSLGFAIIKEGKPFLTDNEKKNEIQPLDFDLVMDAFLYEYKRRTEEYVKEGGTLETIKAPVLN